VRVVAVVVAYNRRALLVEALGALAVQSTPVAGVVVVDNASTDGSAEAAEESAPDADVVQLARNTGGAGGFAIGVERAIAEHGADLVWIMDDDTVPTRTALQELLRARSSLPVPPVVCASRVVWTDGSDHPMNTPRAKPFAGRSERRLAEGAGLVPVRSASFVSSLVDAAAVRASGLPIADYFIWNDDFEFTARLLRRGRGVYCPASVVVHKTRVLGSTDADPGDRFAFEVRNKLWLFRYSSALHPLEKPVYVGASLVRWTRTLRRSRDRRTLRAALRRGLREALGSRPRPNSESLADLPVTAERLRRFERGVAGGA